MGVIKDIISRVFNNTEQNGYLKILILCVFGIEWHAGKGDLLSSNHFRLINRAVALSFSN